jgi:predicted O-linked N-acetylglucosamine transferase (SPINDLY family)
MSVVSADNVNDLYKEFLKHYNIIQEKFSKGQVDSVGYQKSIDDSAKIIEFLDTLDQLTMLNYKDIIKNVYYIRAELLVRTIGISTSKGSLTDHEKNIYNTSIILLRKSLYIEPFYQEAMELYKICFIYLTIYTSNVDDILVYLQQVCYVFPFDYQLQYNIGFAYQRKNDLDKAIEHYKIANGIIDMQMKYTTGEQLLVLTQFKLRCLNGLGGVYYSVQDRHLAKYYFSQGLKVLPNDPDLNNQIAVVYTELRDTDLAIEHYKRGIEHYTEAYISSDSDTMLASMYMNMGLALCYECRYMEAIECYNKSLKYKPDLSLAYQNKLLDLNYISHLIEDPMYIANMHKNINKIYPKVITDYKESLPDYKIKKEGDVLNIGFVSGDYICHPVSYFISSVLKYLSTTKFKITCFSTKIAPINNVYPNCTCVLIKNMDSNTLRNTIKEANIDILFDLSGHTGDNRLDTFVLKPAPIQISYIGYPGSSGINSIDYRFTDKYCDNVHSEKYYSEKLVYLDNCFLNYTPSIPVKDLVPLISPCKSSIVFGSFNRYNKINGDVISVWKSILQKIPQATFLIKTKEFNTPKLKKQFLDSFKDKSITDRITVLPYSETYLTHLPDYNKIDISLDTFPYAGTTTSCETLLMGVPVITLFDNVKHYHSQNVTSSILINSDLAEYVTHSKDEYIQKAVELSLLIKPGFDRNSFKKQTQDKFVNGKVFQKKPFIDSFENTLKTVYHNHFKK